MNGQELARAIEGLLRAPPYAADPAEGSARLFDILRAQIARAAELSPAYGRYVASWPVPLPRAARIADLPYLPVRVFKRDPPLSLLAPGAEHKVMSSSATTGQVPSRIAVDSITAKRMSKGTAAILADFVGGSRRPLLVVDDPTSHAGSSELGARGAAIRGLLPFSNAVEHCLHGPQLVLDRARLHAFAAEHRERAVLVYGFTYLLWTRLARPLIELGDRVELPHAMVLHSGGWKRLVSEAVGPEQLAAGVAGVLGSDPQAVIDYYGMVEALGVVFPDCRFGHKHVPAFADVTLRDPLTLRPVGPGGRGLIQVASALPESFPGHVLLTDDLAELTLADGCACGRRGPGFRVIGRAPRVEVRGCGDVLALRAAG